MRSYEIRLSTPGFDTSSKALARMGNMLDKIDGKLGKLGSSASGIDGLTKRLGKLADQLERVQAATTGITGGAGVAAPRTAAAVTRAAKSKYISGPNQRLKTIAEQLPLAKAEGDTAAEADLERARRLAERSIALDKRRKDDPEHLTRPGLLELLSQMNGLMGKLKSGNIGGAVYHLGQLGQKNADGGINMQQLLGGGGLIGGGKAGAGAAGGGRLAAMAAAAGPYAVPIAVGVTAVTAAVAGIVVLTKAAHAGAASLRENAAAAGDAGATLSAVAGLAGMGVSPGSAGSLGSALRAKLSSDPFAMGVGGYALPGHLSGESNAPLIKRTLNQLRDLYASGNLRELTRRERIYGMEGFDGNIRISPGMRRRLDGDEAIRSALNPDSRLEPANDFERSKGRVAEGWKAMGERIVNNLHLPEAGTAINNWIADVEHWMAGTTWAKVGNPGGGKSQANPVDRNTAALEALNATLKDVVGGGPRAHGALSPAQRVAAQRGANLNTMRDLGAFRL